MAAAPQYDLESITVDDMRQMLHPSETAAEDGRHSCVQDIGAALAEQARLIAKLSSRVERLRQELSIANAQTLRRFDRIERGQNERIQSIVSDAVSAATDYALQRLGWRWAILSVGMLSIVAAGVAIVLGVL